jgi:hypothetical protein
MPSSSERSTNTPWGPSASGRGERPAYLSRRHRSADELFAPSHPSRLTGAPFPQRAAPDSHIQRISLPGAVPCLEQLRRGLCNGEQITQLCGIVAGDRSAILHLGEKIIVWSRAERFLFVRLVGLAWPRRMLCDPSCRIQTDAAPKAEHTSGPILMHELNRLLAGRNGPQVRPPRGMKVWLP